LTEYNISRWFNIITKFNREVKHFLKTHLNLIEDLEMVKTVWQHIEKSRMVKKKVWKLVKDSQE
jgi:phosphoenolpyruvate-protein kinase (PTS system EI component)